MPLPELNLKVAYRSDGDNLIEEFYVPCLRHSVLYRRAVGYFTSGSLSVAAQGIAHLIKNGGRVELVASPHLNDEDVAAIRKGYQDRSAIIQTSMSRSLADVESQLVRDRLNALAWLIREGRLEIKIAFPVDAHGVPRRGLYHEKLGLFTDSYGATVAFNGSANETAVALKDNFEAIDVYSSWDDPHGRVLRKVQNFERLWNNTTDRLVVHDFTKIAVSILEQYRTPTPPECDPAECSNEIGQQSGIAGQFRLPSTITLRGYQIEAMRNWMQNNGRGILKMATGSGKTITALSIVAELVVHIGLKAVLIVCPYKHLVSQWEAECERFGARPLLAFESKQKWSSSLTNELYNASSGSDAFLCVITTNATFASEAFQKQLSKFPKKTLFIADEVHNLGASTLLSILPAGIRMRLGLSATPERWFDDAGTEALTEYFGPVLAPEFTLRDALRAGALVPYRYHPIVVELTPEETDKYLDLSERISKLIAIGGDPFDSSADNPALETLLSKRARLIAVAENKMHALRLIVQSRSDWARTLFYCGDGTISGETVDGEEATIFRHVEAVCQLLGNELDLKVASYTHETSLDDRKLLRSRLETGTLDALVAVRCLDEGVDIPVIEKAVILASSMNPRQFIQRRGRVLRPAPGKQYAEIYDMIVSPPRSNAWSDSERRLLQKELRRFSEFAELAENAGEARASILELQDHFQLLDS
jgi:DNA phosphorothioation system restriction enzyme